MKRTRWIIATALLLAASSGYGSTAAADELSPAAVYDAPYSTAASNSASKEIPRFSKSPPGSLLPGYPCSISLNSAGDYLKPSYSVIIREHAEATGSSSNCPTPINLTVTVIISDFGVGVVSSLHEARQQNSGGPTTSIFASADQNVNMYTFLTDYHGPGSYMEFKFVAHFTWPDNSSDNLCAKATGYFPGPILYENFPPCP